jgi:hypothetical protein
LSGRLRRRRHGSRNTGMGAGSSSEAAKRYAAWRRALRATAVPVKMSGGREFSDDRGSFASAFFIVLCCRLSFLHFGEMPPCLRHLEKPRLVAVVCGRPSHLEAISGIAPIALDRVHSRSLSAQAFAVPNALATLLFRRRSHHLGERYWNVGFPAHVCSIKGTASGAIPMTDVIKFRGYAEDCRRLAKIMKPEHSATLLEIAEAWDRCADEAERKTGKKR